MVYFQDEQIGDRVPRPRKITRTAAADGTSVLLEAQKSANIMEKSLNAG
jgi:hypothetical protein